MCVGAVPVHVEDCLQCDGCPVLLGIGKRETGEEAIRRAQSALACRAWVAWSLAVFG